MKLIQMVLKPIKTDLLREILINKILKYNKRKKEFNYRLQLDNLMENYFITIMKNIKLTHEFSISYNSRVTIYRIEDDITFAYYNDKKGLNIYTLSTRFMVLFGISNQRAESFLKRMIIKYFKLEVDKIL